MRENIHFIRTFYIRTGKTVKRFENKKSLLKVSLF